MGIVSFDFGTLGLLVFWTLGLLDCSGLLEFGLLDFSTSGLFDLLTVGLGDLATFRLSFVLFMLFYHLDCLALGLWEFGTLGFLECWTLGLWDFGTC